MTTRTPTSVQRLRGNPGKHPLPGGAEPQPPALVALNDPPVDIIGEYGAAEWRRLAPILIASGMLTEVDLPILVAFCSNFDQMISARKDITGRGVMVEGARGPIRNPSLAAFQAASGAVRTLGAELGLSPRARARLTMPEEGETLADILGDGFEEDAA